MPLAPDADELAAAERAAVALTAAGLAAVVVAAGRVVADLAVVAVGTVVVTDATAEAAATDAVAVLDWPVLSGSLRTYAESMMGRNTFSRVSMTSCGTPSALSGRSNGRSDVTDADLRVGGAGR